MASRLNAMTVAYGPTLAYKVVGGATRWLAASEAENAQLSVDESGYVTAITADISTEDTKIGNRTALDGRTVRTTGFVSGRNEMHFGFY